MSNILGLWLYGTRIADLYRSGRYNIMLTWRDGADRWPDRSRILSASLPVGVDVSGRNQVALDFLENLLPDGPTKASMALGARVHAEDTFALVGHFGADLAGAIRVAPAGEALDDGEPAYLPVSDAELAALLDGTDSAAFDFSHGAYRSTLAGFQPKLMVHRDQTG
ncbi:HipA N-terminal domain-containing protein [Nakamurella antarctica]|nr:HipA N-terminal domain-containing protein [Nakamurella antarctica]